MDKFYPTVNKTNSEDFVRKMKQYCRVALVGFALSFSQVTYSVELNVGLEPFPPLVNEDGSGLVIDMLNTVSANTELQFNYKIMTYARAKRDLKNKNSHLIGLTPYQLETKNFYQYAAELEWHINTHVDFYSMNEAYFTVENLPDGSIGTLVGNAEFFAEIIDVPVTKFIEVSGLNQLVNMLAMGRLKVILFERVSTISTIQKLQLKNIHYKRMGTVPASLAISNDADGLQLKAKLDELLNTVKNEQFFAPFLNFTAMANSGKVNIN